MATNSVLGRKKTYRQLREIMHYMGKIELETVMEFLDEIDDIDFAEIPIILFSEETKRVLDTYASCYGIDRNGTRYSIYHVGTSLFRIVL